MKLVLATLIAVLLSTSARAEQESNVYPALTQVTCKIDGSYIVIDGARLPGRALSLAVLFRNSSGAAEAGVFTATAVVEAQDQFQIIGKGQRGAHFYLSIGAGGSAIFKLDGVEQYSGNLICTKVLAN